MNKISIKILNENFFSQINKSNLQKMSVQKQLSSHFFLSFENIFYDVAIIAIKYNEKNIWEVFWMKIDHQKLLSESE
jgi:hypothetical protein